MRLILLAAFAVFFYGTAQAMGLGLGLRLGGENVASSGGGAGEPAVLLESGDYVLLESGDKVLLEE